MKSSLIELHTLRHIAGKLNWFSEIIQSGRLHVRSTWDLISSYPECSSANKSQILFDFEWWIDKLDQWLRDDPSGNEHAILNGSEVIANPSWISICQSDASGTDGFGYVYSTLEKSETYQWYSARWGPDRPLQSHEAELRALHHFVLKENHSSRKLIIWIMDNELVAWTVNRGHCADPRALPLLREIYSSCDLFCLQIIALWVPREHNNLTDF